MNVKTNTRVAESVKVTEYPHGILVNGIQKLQALLTQFVSGESPHSDETLWHQPAITAALMSLALKGRETPILRHLFDEMIPRLKSNGLYRHDYDYDGSGTRFFKTSVDVHDLAGEPYVPEGLQEPHLLTLHAAYVGSKVEDGLAEASRIVQGLQWAAVELTLPADGPVAEIDIAAILEPLRDVLGLTSATGEQLAESMMPAERYENFAIALLKQTDNEYAVTLGVDSLSFQTRSKNGQQLERMGSILCGPRREHMDESAPFAPVHVIVRASTLNRWRGHDYDHMPVLKPVAKAEMRALVQAIAGAFQS